MQRRNFIKTASSAAILTSIIPTELLSNAPITSIANNQKICIFSKHLQWLGYSDMAKLASGIGFSGIDLTVRKGGHVLPENVKTDLPEAVKQIRDAGLEVPMITTGITDPEDPLTHNILESAGKLGISIYRTGWYRYQKGLNVQQTLDHAKKQLSKLQMINERYNIAASYQNHAGTYVGSSGWDLMQIIDGLDPKWIGTQFDIRHAMVEGFKTWPIVMELLAPYINSLDIKDFTWDMEKDLDVKNVPLGKGLVDFDTFLETIKAYKVHADFSIHYEYPLGGAEHGDSTLNISKAAFTEQVGSDLDYFKELLKKADV